MFKNEIDRKDYNRYDYGSKKNNHSAVGKLSPCRPRNLIYKLVV